VHHCYVGGVAQIVRAQRQLTVAVSAPSSLLAAAASTGLLCVVGEVDTEIESLRGRVGPHAEALLAGVPPGDARLEGTHITAAFAAAVAGMITA
jgi:hypothetical protein